jgi:cell division protein FtsI/penicillin-binding protein 2
VADHSNRWRDTFRKRALITFGLFALWGAAVEVRLIQLQVFEHDEMQAKADRQRIRGLALPAKRGEIVDREGRVFAYSVDADTITAVPTEIPDPARTAAALCGVFGDCTAKEQAKLVERLSKSSFFEYVRRKVSVADARRIAALELPGIHSMKESRRYYPQRELAAHVLGYVGIDNDGLNGVEGAFDKQVRGQPGELLVLLDAHQHTVLRQGRMPTEGAALELTIDQQLQYIVERELRAGVADNRALGGTAIVMEPHTGEILALANVPTFNPNVFGAFSDTERRNRAVQDVYEPGSTFKVVTASAAFEEHVATPEDPIDVSAGLIRFGSRVIDDVHRYGVLSFRDVLVKSSNVGAIKIGLRLGGERLGRYVERFGFGTRLSRDFRAYENPGLVWDLARCDDSALASVSMGYQVGVTPLQMAAAVSAVANGGELVEPRVVRAFISGGRRVAVGQRVIRRAISEATATELTGIMEEVVERGTATLAQLSGYTVAGKTGTSAKLVDGRYSKSEFNSSFVGFVPSRRPAVTVLVVIDSPHGKGYYGGAIAAPVFKRIAEATLMLLGVPPTVNPAPRVLVARHDVESSAHPATVAAPPVAIARAAARAGDDPTVMPDLSGLSAREAVRALARLGMTPHARGAGVVLDQDPPPGTPIEPGGACRLSLGRIPAAASPPPGTRQ